MNSMNHEKYPDFPRTPDEKPFFEGVPFFNWGPGYMGWRENGVAHACKTNGAELDPRLDLLNHSPTGFEWGYCGSGPAQLSLAILCDYLDDDHEALRLHQRYKFAVVSLLCRDGPWHLTPQAIANALGPIRATEREMRRGVAL